LLEGFVLRTHLALVSLMFVTVMAWGQAPKSSAQPGAAKPPNPPQAAAAKPAGDAGGGVAPDAAVITIQGLCDKPAAGQAKTTDCRTVVTRAEFESLVDAVAPQLPTSSRRQLATQYGIALVMVRKAHEMGLDQGPRFQELMRVARVGVLTKELSQNLQEKASHVSDDDIAKYYHDNGAAFQEADLQRIFIPHSRQLAESKQKPSDDEARKLQLEAEEGMKKEAEALRARAAAGEDFDKLQEEAMTAANLKTKPPTKLGKVRRSSLPAGQSAVFDQKAGEISQLITTPNGYLVYKVGEKDTLPLEKVREEISSTLVSQRFQDSLQTIQQSATPELNERYFAETPPATPQGADAGKGTSQAPAPPPASGPK
jgi:hypothetical protein